MKKRILPCLCLAVLLLISICPFHASAVTPLNPAENASLTLYYQKEGKVFPDLHISIYCVAEAFSDGSYELIEPYSGYPIDIHGITMQEQWKHVASTLDSYISANQVPPTAEAKTDAAGVAGFADLKTGLYFVREVMAEDAAEKYIFNQFMVYLPTPQNDGSYDYSVEAKPKSTSFVPATKHTVTMLWKDAGQESSRPGEVPVDIYRDGVLLNTVILSSKNNWTYSWDIPAEDQGKWSVVDRSVPEPYTVEIQKNGQVFTIINTRVPLGEIPKTGDSFPLIPLILIMSFSGVILLILGIYSRRRG